MDADTQTAPAPLTPAQREALRDAAARATPGPWYDAPGGLNCVGADEDGGAYTVIAESPCPRSPLGSSRYRQWAADRAFIAAANPQAVLALLAEGDALRERAEAAEAIAMTAEAALSALRAERDELVIEKEHLTRLLNDAIAAAGRTDDAESCAAAAKARGQNLPSGAHQCTAQALATGSSSSREVKCLDLRFALSVQPCRTPAPAG